MLSSIFGDLLCYFHSKVSLCLRELCVCELQQIKQKPNKNITYKVQQDWVLTPERFKDAVLMALKNQLLELAFLYVIWHAYPFLSPAGFDKQLPSLLSILIQMIASLPMAEMWFYSGHVLMHASNWCWSHIHYVCFHIFLYFVLSFLLFFLCVCVFAIFVFFPHKKIHVKSTFFQNKTKHHHEWTSPIAITCIYAHWAEHIFINVVTVMLGPFIFGYCCVLFFVVFLFLWHIQTQTQSHKNKQKLWWFFNLYDRSHVVVWYVSFLCVMFFIFYFLFFVIFMVVYWRVWCCNFIFQFLFAFFF